MLYLVILATFIFLYIFRKNTDNRFLFSVGFLFPLQGLALDLGVRVSFSKIAFYLILLVSLIKYGSKVVLANNKISKLVLFMIVYIVFTTILFWIVSFTNPALYQSAIEAKFGVFQSIFRYPVQLILYIGYFGILLLPIWFIKNFDDAMILIDGFLSGVFISTLFGYVQIILGSRSINMLDSRFFSYSYTAVVSQRLFGLSGEPKHIASLILFSLIVYFSSFYLDKEYRVKYFKFYLPKTIFLFVSLLLTFSASGILLLLVFFLLFLFYVIRSNIFHKTNLVRILAALFVVVLVSTAFLLIFSIPKYLLIFDQRFASIDSVFSYEYKDAAFWTYVAQNPLAILVGRGAGGIDFELIPYVDPVYFLRAGTVTPTYFLDNMLGNFGIVLVVALVMLLIILYNESKQYGNRFSRALVVFFSVLIWFSPYIVANIYLLLLISLIAGSKFNPKLCSYLNEARKK